MATTPTQKQTAQQPKQGHALVKAAVAAALARGGANVAELPGAADVAALTTEAGLGAKAVGELTEQVIKRMQTFLRTRAAAAAEATRVQVGRLFPERTPAELDDLVAEEIRREREFQRKLIDRLRRDVPEALKIADLERRRERLQAILEREQRYVEMREEAMHDRAIARAEMLAVKDASPLGAFWQLSPNVKQHTPDCIALAGAFWPWSVIEAVGPPPRHHGCRCSLLTEEEAVDRDLIDPGVAAQVDPREALTRARRRLKDAETVREAVTDGEWQLWLDELHEAAGPSEGWLTLGETLGLTEGADTGGGMIALYPHPEVARKLAVEGGDPPEQLHITLKFLGPDHNEIPSKVKEGVKRALAKFAAGERPLGGRTAGPGYFPPNPAHKQDETPIFAKVDIPGVQGFRERLVKALPAGVMEDSFPDFKPHMTLQYVPKTDKPDLPAVPKTDLEFDHVVLTLGGVQHRYELGTGNVVEADATEARESVLTTAAKCKVCGKPATKALVHAEGRAYVKVCDDCEPGMRRKLGGDLAVDREVDLEEARWQLRYASGYEHGGEFMPKLGGDAGRHILSRAKRALLKATFPELPPSPQAMRNEGRQANLAGRLVHVPKHRLFDRTMGGHRYTSPPFTTQVFRDGKPYKEPHGVRFAKKPALAIAQPHVENDALNRVAQLRLVHGERHDEVMASLGAHDAGHTPAHVGADGETTDRALIDHGFVEESSFRLPQGFQFTYRSPDGVSRLTVAYGNDGKVANVEWEPKPAVPIGRPATQPPRSFSEFTGDAQTLARRLAARHGKRAMEGDWRSATEAELAADEELTDHGAEQRANGDIVLGHEYAPSILTAAAARARGAELTAGQKRDVWAAYQGAAHEAHHAAVPVSQSVLNDRGGYDLNEALTEELSHAEAAKWLTQTGQTDVLQWRADNPTAGKSLGVYVRQRQALDGILNEAKVAPELRQDFMADLLFRTPPHDRFRVLAEAVAATDPTKDATKVERRIRLTMENGNDLHFAPTVPVDHEPTAGAASPFQVGGKTVTRGSHVGYTWRQLRDGRWKAEGSHGEIVGLHEQDAGWTMDVRREDGTVDYAVTPGQVRVVEGEGGDPAAVFGAAAAHVETGTGTIRPGSLVKYDGRADGGYSTARVVRVIRDRNPHAPDKDGWTLEAVTTDDSLAPGTRIILTPERVGGEIAPAGHADDPRDTGGLTSPSHAAPSLEDMGRLGAWFDFPEGTFVLPTERLLAGRLDPPAVVDRVHAAMTDPAGPKEKMPPLAVHPGTDGRFVVTEGGAALEAARRRGLSRLPVILNAVAEVDRHLRSAERQAAETKDEGHVGTVEGLRRARALLARGGRPEDVARDAFGRRAEPSSREEGFQSGMRAAFKTATDSPRAASMALYSSKKPGKEGYGGWGYGFKKKGASGAEEPLRPQPKWFEDKLGDWGGGGSTSARKPQEPKWDDSGTVRLTKAAGGSNGAMFGEDKDGRRWLVKSYKGDRDRIATELLANAIYRRLGIKVPEAGTLTFGGKTALAYPLVEGTPGGHALRVAEPNRALAKGFMADAFLANWDVVGLEHDNLLWPKGTEKATADVEPTRLDHGGTLQFRAMGGRKPFGPVPTEVWTMASARGGQAFGTMDLTDETKREGARAIGELTDSELDRLVGAAPFADEQMRGQVLDALKARRDWMRDYGAGLVSEPKPLQGAQARASLTGGQKELRLFPEQESALRAWGDGWDAVVNDHLKTGAPKEAAAKEVRFLTAELDSLTRHVRTPDDLTLYGSMSGRVRPDGGFSDLTGKTVEERGFMGLTTERAHADGEGAATVRLHVPAGSHALFLHGIPEVDAGAFPAQPEVVLGRRARIRVVRVVHEDGRDLIDATLI